MADTPVQPKGLSILPQGREDVEWHTGSLLPDEDYPGSGEEMPQIFQDGFVNVRDVYKDPKDPSRPFNPLYKSVATIPVCEVNGPDPFFNDDIYKDLTRIWEVPANSGSVDGRPYVIFRPPSESKLDERLTNLSDGLLLAIQAKYGNFEQKVSGKNILTDGPIEMDIRYPLCRSAARDADGFYRIWSYKALKARQANGLANIANALAIERELTLYQVVAIIVAGGLTPSQYTLEEDSNGKTKLFVASNELTIENLIGRIEKSGLPADEKQTIIGAIKHAASLHEERRAALERSEKKKEQSLNLQKIFLGAILVLAIQQTIMVLQAWGIDVRKYFKPYKPADFGTDLTRMAQRGELAPIIGRFEELKQVVKQLAGDKTASVILVGEAGAGKTAIPEKLAQLIALGDKAVELLKLEGVSEQDAKALMRAIERAGIRRIVNVDVTDFIGGTGIRGTLESKVKGFLKVFGRKTGIIAFIDEIHRLIGAGRTDGSTDSVDQAMKSALARGDLRVIGATTVEEYLKYFGDKALQRRFGEPILVRAHSPKEVVSILQTLRERGYFQKLFQRQPTDGAIREAVRLAGKEGSLIDKAFGLIKDAMLERIWRQKPGKVTAEDVREVFELRKKFSLQGYLQEKFGVQNGKGKGKGRKGKDPKWPPNAPPPAAGASTNGVEAGRKPARPKANGAERVVAAVPKTHTLMEMALGQSPMAISFAGLEYAERKGWVPGGTAGGAMLGIGGAAVWVDRMALVDLGLMIPPFILSQQITSSLANAVGVPAGTAENHAIGVLGGFAGTAAVVEATGGPKLWRDAGASVVNRMVHGGLLSGLRETVAVGMRSTLEDCGRWARAGRQVLQTAGSRLASDEGYLKTSPFLAAGAALKGGITAAGAILAGGEITALGLATLGGTGALAAGAGVGIGLGVNALYRRVFGKSLGESAADISMGSGKTLGDWYYKAFLK